MITKQNSFSRLLSNDEKMGAYYTDLGMCARIKNLFHFPDKDECCVLEPSIGDGKAVLTVTGKSETDNIKIFGVELNPNTFDEIQKNPAIDFCINADFLNGVKISHNSFSFCFANPPYGDNHDVGKRFEYLFCEKIWSYLNSRGILCLVIPYYVLVDEKFLKGFFARYQPFATFRFDDAVYQQFKQVVIVAEKRPVIGYYRPSYDAFVETIDSLEKLPYLPTQVPDKQIKVSASSVENIEYFTTLLFNEGEAGKHLEKSALFDVFANKIRMPCFVATELGHPPMPLKKDLLYLTAIAGGGQGLVGSSENGDLHLQRGIAKVVTSSETREENGKMVVVEKQFTKISLNVIESDGHITTLE